MTDADLQGIYSKAAGVSHGAALRTIFALGYAAHAGTTVGANADPSKTASIPTYVPVKDPDGSGRHND